MSTTEDCIIEFKLDLFHLMSDIVHTQSEKDWRDVAEWLSDLSDNASVISDRVSELE